MGENTQPSDKFNTVAHRLQRQEDKEYTNRHTRGQAGLRSGPIQRDHNAYERMGETW